MPSVRQLRRRIRSVENTAKITKAMSMIAASKMRRAQEMALQSRPYAEDMRSLLADLAAQPAPDDEEYIHPLLRRREIKRAEIVVITPDRGLTGGLHSRINRVVGEFILERQKEGVETSVIAVGRKGRDFLVRTGQDVRAVFSDLGDRPELEDVRPIATLVNDEYSEERVDAVYLAYADFVSTVTQRPVVQPLLPVVPAELEYKDMVGYIYEPDPLTVMAALLPRFVDMQVYHAILESVASEQSARMVAMRNATDNANDMVSDLTLEMNKARQESITSELLDIVGGAAAVEA
ncbi:MAG: ATP synthase F1 subunit gamma [Dehalococcoidia bacterium]|nr:ATP synthase F1 subunit gamma [Dehalococcoidia bacterium]MYB47879.1 ATP synthase F1 subunit gamma [Dehalococcoidia bacterium]MYD52372.1 ATP synthase F1 subunit gamma [Dehalococcoidia bacterium]